MWNIFSRDPSKDFAFEIGDIVRNESNNSFWIQHHGKRKANGEAVSIFRYEIKPGEESYIELAKNCLKRLKTLRHPSVLTFYDSLETDKYIVIVTEQVEPLFVSLSKLTEAKDFSISWGLLSVCKGLAFLNNDCSLIHGNLNGGCIFVNNAGDWKISNFEYMSHIDESYPYQKYHSHKLYTAPELRNNKTLNKSVDTWGLGCLIWEIYNGQISSEDDIKQVRNITKKLANLFPVLMSQNPKSRPSVQDFIKKVSQPNGFFNNVFIETMVFLEEFQIKDSTEKNRYFSSLNTRIESIPAEVCKNKILPLIITGLEYGDTGTNMLDLFFKIGKTLSENDFQKRMVPCILKLFSSKDRAVRSKLLKEMEHYADKVPQNMLNEQMFPNLLQGFLDSNPIIREQTVKSICYLAPKLNSTNLNEEVMKHFSRLQFKDPEGGIRTNTIVCIGKIANNLSPATRQDIMLPAFLRSLRDPFPPSRIAGIHSLLATQNFYTLSMISSKVMPSLCMVLMDPEQTVRENAFSALRTFLSKMEKFSQDPTQLEQMENQVNQSGSNVQSKLSFGLSWAVSSLASKITRAKVEEQKIVEKMAALNAGESVNSIVEVNNSKSTQENASQKTEDKAFKSLENKNSSNSTIKTNVDQHSNIANDGWDDCFDDADDNNLMTNDDNFSTISNASKDSSNKFQIKSENNKNLSSWEDNNPWESEWDDQFKDANAGTTSNTAKNFSNKFQIKTENNKNLESWNDKSKSNSEWDNQSEQDNFWDEITSGKEINITNFSRRPRTTPLTKPKRGPLKLGAKKL